jgi:3-phosphoshikimate 1-carboxyvinyltransferase
MLRHFGAEVTVESARRGRVIALHGQPHLRAADVVVPGDPSSAAFAVVAALLVPGSELRIDGLGLNPLRCGLYDTLREMGADLTVLNSRTEGGEPVGDLVVRHGTLHGVEVPWERAPSMIDEYPILAVAAACAEGTTRMLGLKELRVKESDRLSATASMLSANGVSVEVAGDDLIVHGTGRPPSGGAMVQTHMDHRLAMSALVLGLAAEAPVGVDDASFIDTSFPGFVALMNSLVGNGGSTAIRAA